MEVLKVNGYEQKRVPRKDLCLGRICSTFFQNDLILFVEKVDLFLVEILNLKIQIQFNISTRNKHCFLLRY